MRRTILDIQRMKRRGERISMITCYDYTSAQLVDGAEIPLILVGDTLGMVVLGYDSTVPVTMQDMVHHTAAVARGSSRALIVADLPFLSYSTSEQATRNAGRLIQRGGAQAVKLEGGQVVAPIVNHLVEQGIPVMGHLGLTPQSVHQLGGMGRVQGKRAQQALRLIQDSLALEEAGAFAVVLELVPEQLSAEVTRRLRIPTIGIGAGSPCDGQVQVWHDLLGLYNDFIPRHARRYATLGDTIVDALSAYRRDVESRTFPSAEHGSAMNDAELAEAVHALDNPSVNPSYPASVHERD